MLILTSGCWPVGRPPSRTEPNRVNWLNKCLADQISTEISSGECCCCCCCCWRRLSREARSLAAPSVRLYLFRSLLLSLALFDGAESSELASLRADHKLMSHSSGTFRWERFSSNLVCRRMLCMLNPVAAPEYRNRMMGLRLN